MDLDERVERLADFLNHVEEGSFTWPEFSSAPDAWTKAARFLIHVALPHHQRLFAYRLMGAVTAWADQGEDLSPMLKGIPAAAVAGPAFKWTDVANAAAHYSASRRSLTVITGEQSRCFLLETALSQDCPDLARTIALGGRGAHAAIRSQFECCETGKVGVLVEQLMQAGFSRVEMVRSLLQSSFTCYREAEDPAPAEEVLGLVTQGFGKDLPLLLAEFVLANGSLTKFSRPSVVGPIQASLRSRIALQKIVPEHAAMSMAP